MAKSLAEMVALERQQAELVAKDPSLKSPAPEPAPEPESEPSETPPEPQDAESDDDSAESEPDATPPPAAEDDDEAALAEFKESLVERGIPADKMDRLLAKYGNDPAELIRAGIEAEDRIGARDDRAAFMEKLEQAGFPPERVAELVQREWQASQQQKTSQPSTPDDEFDERWVTQGTDGKMYPTASAPPDIAQRWSRHQQKTQAFLLNPQKAIRDMLAQLLPTVTQQSQQLTQVELTKFQQQEQAKAAEAAWIEQHAKEIWVDPSDPSKGETPLSKKIAQLLKAEEDGEPVINPNLPKHKRYERARELALPYFQPRNKLPAVNPKARRSPEVAAPTSGKFDLEKWVTAFVAREKRKPTLFEREEAYLKGTGKKK